jgi:hypothetical protein
MLDLITYALTFVIIAFVLISAVMVHLYLNSHWHVMSRRKVKKSGGKASPTLHESIFQEQKTIKPDDGNSSTLHESLFK